MPMWVQTKEAMTLIKISEDGLSGRSVNPFDRNFSPEKYDEFDKANLPYPLTEPGEPNSEVEAELVWQKYHFYLSGDWYIVKEPEIKEDTHRKAWQVSKPNSDSKESLHTEPPTAEVTEQSIEEAVVLNTSDLYVTINWVTAEVRNVYLNRKDADSATASNPLGSYVTLRLSEYLESILSWYRPELVPDCISPSKAIENRITELHNMCQQTEDWQLQEKYEYAVSQLTYLITVIKALK